MSTYFDDDDSASGIFGLFGDDDEDDVETTYTVQDRQPANSSALIPSASGPVVVYTQPEVASRSSGGWFSWLPDSTSQRPVATITSAASEEKKSSIPSWVLWGTIGYIAGPKVMELLSAVGDAASTRLKDELVHRINPKHVDVPNAETQMLKLGGSTMGMVGKWFDKMGDQGTMPWEGGSRYSQYVLPSTDSPTPTLSGGGHGGSWFARLSMGS